MCECCMHVSVPHAICPQKPEKSPGFPRIKVTGGYELPRGCCEPNSGPPEE